MLTAGDKAPAFSLPADSGKTFDSRDSAGKTLVVYFYPRDSTPGCTREGQAFSVLAAKFKKAGATVVGVSKDSIASHCTFRDKYKLTIPLLSDTDLTVHKAFGAYGKKVMYGKPVEGTIRSTFVIDENGKLAHIYRSVKVDGHAEKVLAAITGEEAAEAKPKKKPAKKKPKPKPKPKKKKK